MEKIIGELNVTTERIIVWDIVSFSSLSEENSIGYCSSKFDFCNESWCLKMYPNGIDEASTGYVSLFLTRKSSGPPIKIEFHLYLEGFHDREGPSEEGSEEVTETDLQSTFEQANSEHGYKKFLLRSKLFETDLLECDIMTISCTLHFPTSVETAGIGKMVKDLGEMFKCKEHSDVIIKVKDEEFRLHKCILACRSPYFRSMFKADMKEKATGVVTIDDCEADVFRNYALFLYTGKVEEMTIKNVWNLYEVADKYQEDQLKKECVCVIKAKMSVECFCFSYVLALKHGDKELLQSATDFFCTKTKEIIQNKNWLTFMTKYPTQANELHVKALHTTEHRLYDDERITKKRRINDNSA